MLSYRNVEEYDLEATLSATEDDPEDNLTLGEDNLTLGKEDMDISSLEDAETSERVQPAESLQERNKRLAEEFQDQRNLLKYVTMF